MKYLKFFPVLMCAVALMSCNGGGNGMQQQAPVPNGQEQVATQPEQPVTDTVVAQQQAATQANAQQQALPEAITAFLNKNFPGAAVVGVETDNEHGGLEYDVYLNDGTEVDFDTRNQWEKVDCKVKAVPASLVPPTIASYVKTNYLSLPITKIDNKRYGYEIELSKGIDLKFSSNCQFMGVDD